MNTLANVTELNSQELAELNGGIVPIFLAGVALGAGAMYVYDHYIK
ncbi:hypothetical protein BWI93_15575 [Siphonobacter sp. BAB-5385]|nr:MULTISPECIES: class IIb bacteriocin, lactobin A/cerein 7B family [unclassified Siphonobacter]OZI07283.1 hypothetical protein BWI93_15575 [Siphonobacter sp. BAB-5385]PMD90373.1 hypothetical protein BWI97_23080 [Siphonobacter sp. BAB-5405]